MRRWNQEARNRKAYKVSARALSIRRFRSANRRDSAHKCWVLQEKVVIPSVYMLRKTTKGWSGCKGRSLYTNNIPLLFKWSRILVYYGISDSSAAFLCVAKSVSTMTFFRILFRTQWGLFFSFCSICSITVIISEVSTCQKPRYH